MDSLTQVVLGGAVAAAIVPPARRRAALLAGAALGTLPDLDALPLLLLSDNPVTQMTTHRGLSHSLLVLPLLGSVLWWLFWRFGNGRVRESPLRWWLAIVLALVTHPLLDALTSYGTQLFWPLDTPPVMLASVFVIDPLYTIWLLAACLFAWYSTHLRRVRQALLGGLLVSSAYLGGGLLAQAHVDRLAAQALQPLGLAQAPRLATPLPFTALLWRVVVMDDDGYWIGDRSLTADRGAMRFVHYSSDVAALRAAAHIPAVQRLHWFNRGFMRARVEGGELILSDLRMGMEPHYSFNFAVARWQEDGQGQEKGGQWQAIAPRRLPLDWPADPHGRSKNARMGAAWRYLWQRLWHAETPPEI